jgi:hypothetical protein
VIFFVASKGDFMEQNDLTSKTTEANWQELALRLLTHTGDPRNKTPQIYLGELPPTMPFEIAIPPQSTLLGSLFRSPEHIEVVIDSELSSAEVLQFYTDTLTAAGWYKPELPMGGPQGGFTHTAVLGAHQGIVFCQGERGPAITLLISKPSAQPKTQIKINIVTDSRFSPCAAPKPPYPHKNAEKWQGIFFILKYPDSQMHFMYVKANWQLDNDSPNMVYFAG